MIKTTYESCQQDYITLREVAQVDLLVGEQWFEQNVYKKDKILSFE